MSDEFRRRVFVSAGVVAGSIVLFGAAFYWLASDLAIQADHAFTSRSSIRNYARSVETLARLKQNVSEVKSYETQIETLLPLKDGLLDLPKWVDTVSRVYQVGTQFAFQGSAVPPAADAAGTVGFALDATASFDSLIKFFRELELKSPRFLLSLGGFDITRSQGAYRAQVQGQAFFR